MVSHPITVVSSATQVVEIQRGSPTVIIGERINPTGLQSILTALEGGDIDRIQDSAVKQVAAGAAILDINASIPGADERTLLSEVACAVMAVVDAPLCIDTAHPDALIAVLDVYEGRPLVNSVTAESRSLSTFLPIVQSYDTAVIGLCMDENGVPDAPGDRLRLAERILNRAVQVGVAPADVVIDPVAVAMGAESDAGRIALETTALIARELGVNTTIGLSNISFGMPDRQRINAVFVAMAIHAGLSCPIANPLDPEVVLAIKAADLAMGRDDYGLRWIKTYRERQDEEKELAAV